MITALRDQPPAGGVTCHSHPDRDAAATYVSSDNPHAEFAVCAECLTRVRPAYESAQAAVAALATGEAITREEADDLADQLTAAGDDWPTAALTLEQISHVEPAAGEYRDLAHLAVDVADRGLLYHSILYRADTGRWWATGWSDASKARIYRAPTGLPPALDDLDDDQD